MPRSPIWKRARALRASLGELLEDAVADDDEASQQALTSARAGGDGAAGIAESLGALVRLANAWLDSDDAALAMRAREAGIEPAMLDTARAAAVTLRKAASAKTLEGVADVRDLPATNVLEGRVVLEMGQAIRAFWRAHEAHPEVRKLLAGAATRHVLDHKAPTKGSGTAAGAGATSPGASGTASKS